MTTSAATPVLPPRQGFSLARLARLVSKELRESLRDRRTLLTLALMPLLLYPLLGIVFFVYFRSPLVSRANTTYAVGFRSEEEFKLLERFLKEGVKALKRDQSFAPSATEEEPEQAEPDPLVRRLPALKLYTGEDLETLVLSGRVDVGIRLLREHGLTRMPEDGNQFADWEMLYLSDNQAARDAVHHLQSVIAAGNGEWLAKRLKDEGIKQRSPPVLLKPTLVPNPQVRHGTLLGALLPLILVLMTITGAVYPAIDLTAGERERGTLEILMAAPIPRLSVLLAKYVAVLTVAMMTALINLAMMTATLVVLGGGPFLFTSALTVLLLLVEVLGLLLLFAAFFSAVLLSLTSLTRSFKEAQAYLIPLMLLALTPGMLSLLPGMKLAGVNLWVPLLNVVLLARDLLDGAAHASAAVLVVIITLVYAILALSLAARIFGRSAIAGV